MPIYEYVCAGCKRKTEVIQRMNEAKLKVCPHCGGKLTKAFSAPAIQFKGSGFYITDYAKADGGKASDKGEKAEAAGTGSDSGEKAEKRDKADKAETARSAEKSQKSEKREKPDKKKKAGSDS